MRVYHGDFPGNANDDMVFAAAQAVDAAGYSEFGVSAFSSGGHSCGCHADGTAMDISTLGGVHIYSMLAQGDLSGIASVMGAFESNPAVPQGSQIMAPYFSDNLGSHGWYPTPGYAPGGSDYQLHTFDAPHIHIQWGPWP